MLEQVLGNPQVPLIAVARVFAALEAAGAWDPAPTELFAFGMEKVLVYLAYTRAAAGGDVQFRVEISPYTTDAQAPAGMPAWFRASVFAAGAVASGADTVSNLQREDVEYGSTAAGQEAVVYGPLDLGQCVERIRVPCAESGAVGTPGSIGVILHFSPV